MPSTLLDTALERLRSDVSDFDKLSVNAAIRGVQQLLGELESEPAES